MHSKIVFACLIFALFSYGYTTAAAATTPRKSYLRQFMGCGLTKDVSCFLDVAEELVEEKRTEILGKLKVIIFNTYSVLNLINLN